jgi:phenylpyruvate tautomerase PptA (4-oxalocrotonate tautomerase family)
MAVFVTCVIFGLVIGSTALAGHHEPLLQVVAVKVKPGKLEKYRAEVKKLRGVLKRVGSEATVRMWNATQAGPDTGTILVALEYPNAAAWAAGAPKVQSDEEWQDIVADLDELRTLEGSALWRDISPNQSTGSGSFLLVTGVSVKPGKVQAYRDQLDKGAAITERLGLSGRLRIWQATLAGANTGNIAVAVEYKDLATYVSEQAKIAADKEWQKLLSGLDAIRTIQSRSLYREITP